MTFFDFPVAPWRVIVKVTSLFSLLLYISQIDIIEIDANISQKERDTVDADISQLKIELEYKQMY